MVHAAIVMVPPGLVLKYWHTRSGSMEENVRLYTQKLLQEMLCGVAAKADLLSPLKLFTINLARIISSYLKETQLSNPLIESENTEIEEVDKPLSGKKVLLVDDENLLQRIASSFLSGLGATVGISVNGQKALHTVCKDLQDQRTSGTPHFLPYDYIFMNCEMPVMDGIEATWKIREEETKHGVHMPIFAVSAHTDGPKIEQMKEARVDYNFSKPLCIFAKIKEFLSIFEV